MFVTSTDDWGVDHRPCSIADMQASLLAEDTATRRHALAYRDVFGLAPEPSEFNRRRRKRLELVPTSAD
jgi:hypothetical protein